MHHVKLSACDPAMAVKRKEKQGRELSTCGIKILYQYIEKE